MVVSFEWDGATSPRVKCTYTKEDFLDALQSAFKEHYPNEADSFGKIYMRNVLPNVMGKKSIKFTAEALKDIFEVISKNFVMNTATTGGDFISIKFLKLLCKNGTKVGLKKAILQSTGCSALSEAIFLYAKTYGTESGTEEERRKRWNGCFGESIMTVAGHAVAHYGLACAGLSLSGPVGWAVVGVELVASGAVSYGFGKVGGYIGRWF